MQEGRNAGRNSPRKELSENQLFKCFCVKNAGRRGLLRLRISKKFIRSAVKRNKIKRWIREIYRKMNFKNGFDVYVSVRKTPVYDFGEFRESLSEVFGNIK